jgi:hypothetical protein
LLRARRALVSLAWSSAPPVRGAHRSVALFPHDGQVVCCNADCRASLLAGARILFCVIFGEIFCALWSRLTAARMRMHELENLNPHLFEASKPPTTAIYRTRKAQNNFQSHRQIQSPSAALLLLCVITSFITTLDDRAGTSKKVADIPHDHRIMLGSSPNLQPARPYESLSFPQHEGPAIRPSARRRARS